MKSLKGTQTEKNLLISFAGESQARNRYTFFAKAAKAKTELQARPDVSRDAHATSHTRNRQGMFRG